MSVALVGRGADRGEPSARRSWAPPTSPDAEKAAGRIERDGEPVRLEVSDRDASRAVVATGFPFRRTSSPARRATSIADDRALAGSTISAAPVPPAWTSLGRRRRLRRLLRAGLGPWDVAAGGLLIQAAGGVVTDWDGGPAWMDGDVMAGRRHPRRTPGRLRDPLPAEPAPSDGAGRDRTAAGPRQRPMPVLPTCSESVETAESEASEHLLGLLRVSPTKAWLAGVHGGRVASSR